MSQKKTKKINRPRQTALDSRTGKHLHKAFGFRTFLIASPSPARGGCSAHEQAGRVHNNKKNNPNRSSTFLQHKCDILIHGFFSSHCRRLNSHTETHAWAPNKYNINSPCAFEWKSSIHMAAHADGTDVHTNCPPGEDAHRETETSASGEERQASFTELCPTFSPTSLACQHHQSKYIYVYLKLHQLHFTVSALTLKSGL